MFHKFDLMYGTICSFAFRVPREFNIHFANEWHRVRAASYRSAEWRYLNMFIRPQCNVHPLTLRCCETNLTANHPLVWTHWNYKVPINNDHLISTWKVLGRYSGKVS